MQLRKRIAVASCESLPGWEVDDRPFLDALGLRAETSIHAWCDSKVRWSDFDCIVLRTTWDYTERLNSFLKWVDEVSQQTLLLNTREWIHWNCRKSYLADLASAGVSIAPTHWITHQNLSSVAQLIGNDDKHKQWFIKPKVGATSSHTLRFSSAEITRADAFIAERLPDHDFLLQPYLKSVETEGEYSLLYMGGQWTHGVRKVPLPGDYRVQDDFGAHDEPFLPTTSLKLMGQEILEKAVTASAAKVPLLYARLDFLRSANGDWLLNEFEAIEPSLFFRHSNDAHLVLADAILEWIA